MKKNPEKASRASERSRLTLDLDANSRKIVDEIIERSGSLTITELIRRALALYSIIVEHRRNGGKVVFKHPDGREETLLIL
jgi:hypothetical protein